MDGDEPALIARSQRWDVADGPTVSLAKARAASANGVSWSVVDHADQSSKTLVHRWCPQQKWKGPWPTPGIRWWWVWH